VSKRRTRRFLDHHYEEDEDDEEASEVHLQQLYDLRTWDLYMRITDARKQRQLERELERERSRPRHHIPHAARPGDRPRPGGWGCEDDEAGTEPTTSPDSDYGWYDEFPNHPRQQQRPARTAAAASAASSASPSQISSQELIFGEPEL
jgi:hypothetical protein